MSHSGQHSATILIASNSTTDAALVKKLLMDEFENVFISTHPDGAAEDFDRRQPDVLVLAFESLEKSERYNLGLFRQSKAIHQKPHHAIILCNRGEVQRAYELCREDIFDDYILFRPPGYDAPRLPMAVHHALRRLAADNAPRSTELSSKLRRLAEFETFLKERMEEGDEHIESTHRFLTQAEHEITAAFAGFSRRMTQGELSDLVEVRNAKALEAALDRLKHEAIDPPLHSVVETFHPLRRWAKEFQRASAPHLDLIRSLNALAASDQSTVMVVDDDEFQHQIVSVLLEGMGYRLVYAASGIQALNMLHKMRPDLILMDVSMPDMDGMEVTRRVKGVARFSNIPIIMITGNSDQNVVTESLRAGAIDFLVKPLGREAVIAKIARVLGKKDPVPAEPPPPELNQSDVQGPSMASEHHMMNRSTPG